ncbi:MAG: hypothetical protein IJH12_02880 [Clostridia bacterium]|nr:hypothetical protein [Clostridia bacterium]
MSIEKQRLYDEIQTLPDELIGQVINFMEFLKFSNIDIDGPDELAIKSKSDLKEKLQRGIDDINEGKVYSLDEVFEDLDKI